MSAKRFQNPLHMPGRLQQQKPPNPQQRPMAQPPQPMPGQQPRKQNPGTQPVDPRRIVVDQIIRDCYSKTTIRDGQTVAEIKYNTHLGIREYSQYPQQPPPTDIPPSQIGSVKNRILTVCTKHSGRVFLQKGKYNDTKHVFQIGRTWDLDELLAITRVGADAVIMLLNKDYYWKSGEGTDRFLKFIHHLAVIFAKFTGKYPQINGFNPEELMLPPLKEIAPNAPLASNAKREAPPKKPSGPPAPPPELALYYGNMDFTANGKLPLKPMMVMDVDRPGPPLNTQKEPLAAAPASHKPHPYSQISLASLENYYDSQNDSQQSFVFSPDVSEQAQKLMPTISEYAQATGRTLPLRKYKPEVREEEPEPVVPGSFDNDLVARMDANQTNESLNFHVEVPIAAPVANPVSDTVSDSDSVPVPVAVAPVAAPPTISHEADFGIEEGILSEDESHQNIVPQSTSLLPETSHYDVSSEIIEESTQIDPNNAIDNSIRDIENFMDTQFGPSTRLSQASLKPDAFEDSRSNLSYDDRLNRNSLQLNARAETPATEPEIRTMPKFEKDAEVEEMFDEIEWSTTDSSDAFVKKLSRELNEIKRRNIHELRFLDFGKDTLANEVAVASNEVDNLVEVFKKMEVSLNLIGPKIDDIESNSKGLQVRAVNRKILFNDLSEILNKVRVSPKALDNIAHYNSFLDVETVESLEQDLVILFDALGTIGSTTDEDLSNMKALRQFQDTYAATSSAFIRHFVEFMLEEFRITCQELDKEVDTLYPRNLLAHMSNFLAYSGLSNFVKWVSERDLRVLSDNLNSYLSQFLESLLKSRLGAIAGSAENGKSSRLSQNFDLLRKSKSRFGSTRLINKFASSSEERRVQRLSISGPIVARNSDEISDPKIILRMVHETNELITVVQYFSGSFFHSTSIIEYSDFVKAYPFYERMQELKDPNLDVINYKSNSNDLLKSMTAIFGNYVNRFIKELTPSELITPQLLQELYRLIDDATRRNQDFMTFSFMFKVVDRYKGIWNKFIASQVDLLNKSDIRPKSGVLPVVRNLNQILLTTETSLLESIRRDQEGAQSDVDQLIKDSYSSLTKAAVDLFSRDDPLLKSNSHDEKERAHRNVAILQNVFAICQELKELNSATTAPVQKEMTDVFKKVENEYFEYLFHRYVGKMFDFVKGYSGAESSKRKKDDKILVHSLATTHTSKEIQPKIVELNHKLEKHFIVTNSMEEIDLVKRLWADLGAEFVSIFQRFDGIVKANDRDAHMYATPSEIRRMFEITRSTR